MVKHFLLRSLFFICISGLTFDTLYAQGLDANIKSITVPEPKFGMTENEAISVEVENSGTVVLSEIFVKVIVSGIADTIAHTETILTELAPGEVISYTFNEQFDFTGSGIYNVDVELQSAEDINPENNYLQAQTFKLARYEEEYPLIENFDDISLTTNILSENPSLPGLSFFTNNKSNYLKVVSNYIRIEGSNGESANLIYTLDLSNQENDHRDFFMHYKLDRQKTYDGEILVRGGENDTWIPILETHEVFNSHSDSSASHYLYFLDHNLTEILHNAGQQFSSTTQILFRVRETFYVNQNYMVVEEVRFWHREDNEIALENISPYYYFNDSKIRIQLSNKGKYAQKDIPVTLEFEGPDGLIAINHIVNEEISPNKTQFIEIPYELPSEGDYTVRAYLSLDNDGYRHNDTLTTKYIKPSVYNGGFPYEQDFENLSDLYLVGTTTQIPSLPGFSFISSRSILSTKYNAEDNNTYLDIERIHTPGDLDAVDIMFTADLSSFENMESLIVEFEFDTPCSDLYYRGNEEYQWKAIKLPTSSGHYIINILDSLKHYNQEVGKRFQLAFANHNSIDNFKISPGIPHDVSLVNLVAPDSKIQWTTEEILQVEVLNRGRLIEKELPLVIEVTSASGVEKYEEVLQANLAPNESKSYVIGEKFDLSEHKEYSFKVYLNMHSNISTDTVYSTVLRKENILAVKENISSKLSVYPNPNDGILYYQTDNDKVEEINIYSSSGIHLSSFEASNGQINLQGYEPGNYFIQFKTDKELIYRQLILK